MDRRETLRWDAVVASVRELARGAGAFFAVQCVGTGLAFVAQVYLARVLGAPAYGDYTVAYGWIALLSVLCTGGHAAAALRFSSQYLGAQDWARLRGYFAVAGTAVAISSAGIAILLLIASRLGAAGFGDNVAAALAVGALVMPLQAGLIVAASILRGLRWPALSQVPASLLQPSLLIACVAIAPAIGHATGGREAMIWTTLSTAAAFAATCVLIRAKTPVGVRAAVAVRETPGWTRVALPMLAIAGLNVVMQRADVLIVGAQLGTQAAGVYSAATKLALLVSFGLTAVNAWVAPAIADLHARGERAELQRVVRLAARGVTAFTLPVALGTVCAGGWLLGLFGPAFESGWAALSILCLGQLVNALLGPVGYLMTMTGNQSEAARILGVSALANVVLCALLTPRFGIVGAALGTAFAQVLWNVWMSVAVWRRLGVRATVI